MKFQRKIWMKSCVLLGILFLFVAAAGCGQEQEEAQYHIEYMSKDKNRIVKMPYEPKASDTDGMIAEFLAVLSSDSEYVECRKPIPSDVEVINYSLDGVLLTIWFDTDYYNMTTVEEVLCRAAVVRTLIQIDGVECVAFYVGDTPLADSAGNMVGSMTRESFVENPERQINTIQETSLTLYFANDEGTALVKEVRPDVYYSSNIALEKLVMEKLIEGPQTKGARAAIPEGTRLVSVSVVDGICYVSLDETFRNQDYKVAEGVVIYSIVNSLTELPTVNQVQISVNGDTSGNYRDNFPLSTMYDRNLNYLNSDTETTEKKEE